MKNWLVLPCAAAGIVAVPVAAQDMRAPQVFLYTLDDMNDEAMIRPTRPLDGYENWVSAADYPADALADRRDGYAYLTIRVAADGSVLDCAPDMPGAGNDPGFVERACAIIRQRGRFRHAIDADGKPHPGKITMAMRFALMPVGGSGALPPAPPAPGSRNQPPKLRDGSLTTLPADAKRFVNAAPSVWLDIDADGRVTKCRIRTSSGTDGGDAWICKRMTKAKFDPSRDRNGRAVERLGYYVPLRVAP